MKIRCLVIDDEPAALEKLKNYVGQTPCFELVAACESPDEAMEIIAKEDIDAIFTDINMAGLNGLEFVSSLSNCPMVVFITAYSEYAVDSYKINAVDYIVKPYGLNEFHRAADRVRRQFEQMQHNELSAVGNSLFVRTDHKWLHIKADSIRYIQACSDYIILSLNNIEKRILTYSTLSAIQEYLPETFIQIHKSWIINIMSVSEITKSKVVMDDDKTIPIGETFKDVLNQFLGNRLIGKTNKQNKQNNL